MRMRNKNDLRDVNDSTSISEKDHSIMSCSDNFQLFLNIFSFLTVIDNWLSIRACKMVKLMKRITCARALFTAIRTVRFFDFFLVLFDSYRPRVGLGSWCVQCWCQDDFSPFHTQFFTTSTMSVKAILEDTLVDRVFGKSRFVFFIEKKDQLFLLDNQAARGFWSIVNMCSYRWSVVAVCLVMVVIFREGNGEIFSSMSDVETLISTERELLNLVRNLRSCLSQKLNDIER